MLPWTELQARKPEYRKTVTTSRYLTMRDGVQIAVDVTLPVGLRGTAPTILRQTRYHRRMSMTPPFDRPPLLHAIDNVHASRLYFVTRGYAWVDVCVRGSGASGGERPTPWADGERGDGAELIEWASTQPWSNGKVGARGISYDGTAAEYLMWHGHPALRAVAPRFSLFDVYDDIAMPGGVHLSGFTENWLRFNNALDRNRFDEVIQIIFGLSSGGRTQLASSTYSSRFDRLAARALGYHAPVSKLLSGVVHGVAPTDESDAHERLAGHLRERRPALDVYEAGRRMTFRDDVGVSDANPELAIDDFSPHAKLDEIPVSIPVYHYTGWFDGAYQRAAIKRFRALDDPGQRLIIGPWEHGGRQDVSPWSPLRASDFSHEEELMRFFDAHLRDDDRARADWDASPAVRYYTMGAERWRTADTWPPAGNRTERLHLDSSSRLRAEAGSGESRLPVFGTHGTGRASRWRSLLPTLTLTHYLPRDGEVARFDSERLSDDLELTGHPVVHIELTASHDDPRLFAYLEDVDTTGVAHYITEGQLRAIHRRLPQSASDIYAGLTYRTYRSSDAMDATVGSKIELEFDLLPTSFLLRRGHRLRLVLAGADADNFDVGPSGTYTIDHGNSWIDLPVAAGTLGEVRT